MPRNASGTFSLSAGNPVVSGTTISTTTHNNTMGDIATELSDSLSRSGKGGMTAPLRTADGTVAAPAHSFTNETGTGVYRKGASNPAIAVGGSERQEWTTAGSRVAGTFEATGNTTVGGTLGVTGSVTFSGAGSFGGALDMNSHAISEVTDPSNAQDAATKNYVDVTAGTSAATASKLMRRDASGRVAVADPSASGDAATKGYVDGASITLTASSGWSMGSSRSRQAGHTVWVYLDGSYSSGGAWSSLATLPVGSRPDSEIFSIAGSVYDSSATTLYPAFINVTAAGVIYVWKYDNGTALIDPFAIGSGDIVRACFSFIAS